MRSLLSAPSAEDRNLTSVIEPSVPVALPGLAPRPPAIVSWWSMVAPSSSLRRGRILRFQFGDMPVVLFRGREDGVVRALPGHCLHQGVDLSRGTVVGNCLRCPLHHWEYSDRLERIPRMADVPAALREPSFVAVERYGMIFVHPGGEPPPLPVPEFVSADEGALYFHPGTPVSLECPWYVPVANGFDMTHLQTVHRRTLTSEIESSYPNEVTFVIRYSTAVTGNGWSDRAMRMVSGNRVDVIVTCAGGTIVMIEATAGRQRSFMLISLRPVPGGVSILPLYAVLRRRSGAHLLHARMAKLLFQAFLHRDLEALEGIRFPDGYRDALDPTINACYRHLCNLPAYRRED